MDSSGSIAAIRDLINTISKISKDASNELRSLPREPAVVKTIFVYMRAYYEKVHSLADYIYSKESYTIKAVKEDNAKELQDYLDEVLSKSEACKKDLTDLIIFIQTAEKLPLQLSACQENRVQQRMNYTGIFKKAGLLATLIGVSCSLIAMNSNGFILVFIVGFVIASMGLYATIKGSSALSSNQEAEKRNLLLAIDNIKSFIENSRREIDTALKRLKPRISFEVQGSPHSNKSSAIQSIREVTAYAGHLKEYCQPFKNAETLEHFITYQHEN